MTALSRVRVGCAGFPGGPGVSTFYFLDLATALASLATYYGVVKDHTPPDVTFTVESIGDIIEDTTGAIVGTWNQPLVPTIAGVAVGAYAAPTGAAQTWLTDGIVAGKRVRGRTFLVPLASGTFQTDGTLDNPTAASIALAGVALVTSQSASFVVWSRPFKGSPAVLTRPARPARLGSHHLITGTRVTDKAAVLRSRRD